MLEVQSIVQGTTTLDHLKKKGRKFKTLTTKESGFCLNTGPLVCQRVLKLAWYFRPVMLLTKKKGSNPQTQAKDKTNDDVSVY